MKRILITGTSSGFGRAMVTRLLRAGHHVFASLRDAAARRPIFDAELAEHGDRLQLIDLDVTCPGARACAAEQVGGSLDALVNNAGHAVFGALEDLTESQLRDQFEVNFMGAALLTRELLPALRAGRGALINVSSVFGYAAFPLTSAYCASKYALEGLSESLYHELRPHGVRVHLVEPGGHRTRFAESCAWAAGTSATYAGQTAAYRALRDRLAARRGRPPEAVAALVLDLIERPSTRLRAPVGPDAWVAAAWKRLPDRLAAPLSGRLYDRLFLPRVPS